MLLAVHRSRISYNHLNLPVQITFSTPGTNLIIYLYDALGNKLKKSVAVTENGATVPTETDYLNGFQYVGASITFPTAQGYVTAANGIYNYIFNFTDHLGNVRLSYAEDPKTPGKLRILEENHYYPYGLKHQNYNAGKFEFRSDETGGNNEIVAVNDPQYKYKFNGQELQQELGLNMTAMDFRQYDNAIGRFVGMDALSEMGFSNTPYHFGAGNPVYFSDPSGLKVAPTEATAGGHIEGPSWIQTMWESTTTFSTWTNGGGGAFYNSGNTQGVDTASGELFATLIGVGLDNIDVLAGSNSDWLGSAQDAVYSTIYYQAPGQNGNQQVDLLDFNLKLMDRFKESGIDPNARAQQTPAHIMSVIKGVRGLEAYWKRAGSPNSKIQGSSSRNYRGYTGGTPETILLYNGAFKNNYWLASTLFHEITHAYTDKYLTIDNRESERMAYSLEWQLGNRDPTIWGGITGNQIIKSNY